MTRTHSLPGNQPLKASMTREVSAQNRGICMSILVQDLRYPIGLPINIRMNKLVILCCRAADSYPEWPPLDWLRR